VGRDHHEAATGPVHHLRQRLGPDTAVGVREHHHGIGTVLRVGGQVAVAVANLHEGVLVRHACPIVLGQVLAEVVGGGLELVASGLVGGVPDLDGQALDLDRAYADLPRSASI